MKVRVTEEHIRLGKPGDLKGCPIALALSEVTHRPCWAGYDVWGYMDKDNIRIYIHAMMERMTTFDSTGKMKPFEFEIPDSLGAKA